jgi:hypothetical protein
VAIAFSSPAAPSTMRNSWSPDEIDKHGAPSLAAFGTHAFAKLRLVQAAMAKRDIRVGDPNAFASFAILAARLCHHPLALVYDRRETHRAV